MKRKLVDLRDELGLSGACALVVLAALALLHMLVLAPMHARKAELQARSSAAAPRAEPGAAAGATGEKVEAVYEFLGTQAETPDWLAKLHTIAAASGVQMKSASYGMRDAEGRIVRYEMVLPVAGSYAQIREFLKRSAAEVPVMSLDQLSLKRESRKDPVLQAELRLTFHMVKS
jgi:Tfp pilus assembly protein PilO